MYLAAAVKVGEMWETRERAAACVEWGMLSLRVESSWSRVG